LHVAGDARQRRKARERTDNFSMTRKGNKCGLGPPAAASSLTRRFRASRRGPRGRGRDHEPREPRHRAFSISSFHHS
jgi:hypothetical protein